LKIIVNYIAKRQEETDREKERERGVLFQDANSCEDCVALVKDELNKRRERWCNVTDTRKPKYLEKKRVPLILCEASICGINLLTDTSQRNSEPLSLV